MRSRLLSFLTWCWILIAVATAAGVIWYVLWGGPATERTDRAQVAGTLWTVMVVMPPLLAWAWNHRKAPTRGSSSDEQVRDAAEFLARRLEDTWSAQVIQRGIELPAPVAVRWSWAEGIGTGREDLQASPGLGTDPLPLPGRAEDSAPVLESGTVDRLHDEVYAELQHGRLVLVGKGGAGKTGAMILLLVRALRERKKLDPEQRARTPVPVWLTMGSWDPRSHGLREWVRDTLARDHPYLRAAEFGPDAPRGLVETRRVALFLDGLDEMPDALQPEALRRLREESAGLRIVLSSRPTQYERTVDTQHLPLTAVIHLQPVCPADAAEYLLTDQGRPHLPQWQKVADHLLTHPDSVAARTLNTPLTLSLARATYTREDPAALISPRFTSESQLRAHLLDHFLVTAYPHEADRNRARYWLGWIAHHLDGHRDLPWWHIPSWLPRRHLTVAVGLTAGLAVGLTAGLTFGLTFGLAAGLAFGLTAGLTFGRTEAESTSRTAPRMLVFRWPSSRKETQKLAAGLAAGLAFGLTAGLAAGLAFGLAFGLTAGLAAGLAFGLTFGLMFGLAFGLAAGLTVGLVDTWSVPTANQSDVTPKFVHQKDSHLGLAAGLTAGLTFGLTVGLAVGLTFGLPGGLTFGLAAGLAAGLAFGLEYASGRLGMAEVALWVRGRGVRFMPLLEGALERQVLRQAGAMYQFRHADLQDHLAAWYREHHLGGVLGQDPIPLRARHLAGRRSVGR